MQLLEATVTRAGHRRTCTCVAHVGNNQCKAPPMTCRPRRIILTRRACAHGAVPRAKNERRRNAFTFSTYAALRGVARKGSTCLIFITKRHSLQPRFTRFTTKCT